MSKPVVILHGITQKNRNLVFNVETETVHDAQRLKGMLNQLLQEQGYDVRIKYAYFDEGEPDDG
jgi:hypothetical protein